MQKKIIAGYDPELLKGINLFFSSVSRLFECENQGDAKIGKW